MIGLLINVNSKSVRRDPAITRRLRTILGKAGLAIETHTLAELRAATETLHSSGATVLAICGGDGTTMASLTESIRAWYGRGAAHLERVAAGPPDPEAPHLPLYAFLRGGTVNTVARNFGFRGTPESILERLVSKAAGGRIPTRAASVMGVNERFGFIFGAGMPARFFEAYYGGPTTGIAWASALAARTIASGTVRGPFARWLFEPHDAEVEVDGSPLAPRRFTFLVGSTVRDVGLGVRATYRAGESVDRFQFLASSLSARTLVGQAVRVFLGRPLEGTPHTDVLASHVRIRFPATQPYILDGDLFSADRLEVRAGPKIEIART